MLRRSSHLARSLATLVAAWLLLDGAAAAAQGVAIGRVRETKEADDNGRSRLLGPSLRGVFGVTVAERLITSASPDERLRGIVRLGAIGTPEAIDVLAAALEQSTVITRDGRARLEAIRALAPHAHRENVRPLLVRELSENAEGRASATALSSLTRGTAALALAKTGEKKALAALVATVVQGGAAGDAATMALVEHPPVSLSGVLEGRRRIEPAIANMLATIGDVRAQERLRLALSETDPAFQSAAALALIRLGDSTPVTLARAWVRSEDNRQRKTGAELLARLGTNDADEAIGGLLGANGTRSEGVRLAFAAPRKELIKPLVETLPALAIDDREKAIAALGRIGGPEAVTALMDQFAKPELATAVAYALARMPGKEARNALDQALASASTKTGAPRRLVVRAATVRALFLRDEPAGLGNALEQLARDKAIEDRAVSLFGRVATGRTSVRAGVEEACANAKACDAALVAAVARASLARGPRGPVELARVFSLVEVTETPSPIVIAAGVALLADPSAEGLSTNMLSRWAEEGGPLAPLAARALCTRDGDTVRTRIERLLRGTDPIIRAHTALGLAIDPEPDAVSLLVNAYRFEEEAGVRRAILRALSARSEPQRNATLALARDLDPDDAVRALARAALAGRALLPPVTDPAGTVLWVSLVANTPSALSAIAGRAARFVRPDGLALPVIADPDGVLIVPGMPDGRAGLTLAPEPVSGDAPSP